MKLAYCETFMKWVEQYQNSGFNPHLGGGKNTVSSRFPPKIHNKILHPTLISSSQSFQTLGRRKVQKGFKMWLLTSCFMVSCANDIKTVFGIYKYIATCLVLLIIPKLFYKRTKLWKESPKREKYLRLKWK